MVTPDRPNRGTVTIRDDVDTTLDDQGAPRDNRTGRVTAVFQRVTVASVPPMVDELGVRCLGVTSRGVDGEETLQGVGTITVDGLAPGALAIEPRADLRYVFPISTPLDGAAANVDLSAPGATFSGFTGSIPSIAPLALLEPPAAGTGELLFGELVVRWTPGSADYVEIQISPDVNTIESQGGQVVCQVADDGCYTVPAMATTFLLAADVPTYTVAVRRTNARLVEPDPDTVVELEVVSEARFTIQNGVLP